VDVFVQARRGFGPDVPGQIKVDFADIEGLRAAFEKDGDKIAAFIFEPIQGEAGVSSLQCFWQSFHG
jgi:ornithine--oxo-acid transaminase